MNLQKQIIYYAKDKIVLYPNDSPPNNNYHCKANQILQKKDYNLAK